MIAPLETNASVRGLDVFAIDDRRAAIVRARTENTVAATALLELVQAAGKTDGLIYYMPVTEKPDGVVALVHRTHLTLRRVFHDVIDDTMNVAVRDVTESDAPVELYRSSRDVPAGAIRRIAPPITVAGRKWELSSFQAPLQPRQRGKVAYWTLATGFAFTGLLGVLILILTGHALSVEAEVGARLADREHRFRALLESAPDAVVIADANGSIAYANEQVRRLLGYGVEIVGRSVETLVPAHLVEGHRALRGDAERGRIPRMMGAGRILGARHADGHIIPVDISLSMIQTNEGKLFYAAIRDATERQHTIELQRRASELEQGIQRANEANRLKGELLATMSHELRTPLNGILGFAQLLLSEKLGPLTPTHKQCIADIRTSGQHLLRLVNDVLDMAKLEAGKLELALAETDIGALVNEVVEVLSVLAQTKHIELVMEPPAVATARTDALKVKQIVYNYVSNAVKFAPAQTRVRIAVIREGEHAFRIAVHDQGRGIPIADQAKLFSEFIQLGTGHERTAGSGIGLALSKRLAEALGGSVGVESDIGKGSTFWVVLPLETRAREVAA
ncbi:MAG: PAS domain S-box protein [Deltaproteobacteria bacterium]|nr:PAS domain S-box protein [Deltaproteobacteria bacterium]